MEQLIIKQNELKPFERNGGNCAACEQLRKRILKNPLPKEFNWINPKANTAKFKKYILAITDANDFLFNVADREIETLEQLARLFELSLAQQELNDCTEKIKACKRLIKGLSREKFLAWKENQDDEIKNDWSKAVTVYNQQKRKEFEENLKIKYGSFCVHAITLEEILFDVVGGVFENKDTCKKSLRYPAKSELQIVKNFVCALVINNVFYLCENSGCYIVFDKQNGKIYAIDEKRAILFLQQAEREQNK